MKKIRPFLFVLLLLSCSAAAHNPPPPRENVEIPVAPAPAIMFQLINPFVVTLVGTGDFQFPNISVTQVDKSTHKVSSRSVDPKLDLYVRRFELQALEHGKAIPAYRKLTVQFGRVEVAPEFPMLQESLGPSHGTCQAGNMVITATISNDLGWDELTDLQKEQEVFHQLGHCLLGRDHDNGWYEWNDEQIPGRKVRSVMNRERTWIRRWYAIYHQEYIDELFR